MRVLCIISFVVTVSAHTYHSSIAQLDYISGKKTIEAIVWLHTEDIERAFKAQHGASANFDDPAAAERFVGNYLKSHFELHSRGKLLAQKWVGLEVKVHFVAAYFEVPLAEGLDGVTLSNRLLLDRVPDQVNAVQVRQDGKPRHDFTSINATATPIGRKVGQASRPVPLGSQGTRPANARATASAAFSSSPTMPSR